MALKNIKKKYIAGLLAFAIFFLLADYLKKSQNTALDNVVVVLKVKVPKDDVLQLFYWEASDSMFKIEKSVRNNVKGTDDFQDIVFKLPKIEDLFRLRLDIGENFDQGTIIIKEIRFIKEDTELVFGINDFNKLFGANKYIIAADQGNYTGKTDIVNSKKIYDPYFISVDTSQEMESIRFNRFTDYPYLVSALICLVIFLFALSYVDRISFSPHGLFILTFVLILFLPMIQNEIQFTEPLENLEKRELAEKPEFSFTKKFATEFEAYHSDNFGLRNHLINWGGTFRTKLFRSSMHPELVKFGKGKWLFYNRMKSRMYRSYSRTNILPQDTLKMVVDKWQDNKKRYEADGRKYFLAFWPNKHSIYPEYMPSMMKIQIKDTVPRVDQIMQYIENSGSTARLTDVRPTLLKHKKDKQLYHKFDSHWNDYGAFLAYQQFFTANKTGLGMAPKTTTDFNITWGDYNQGELIQMLGVHNKGFFVEQKAKFELKTHKDQIEYLPIDGFPRLTVITRNEHAGNSLRALIFRDSFSNSLIQFFSLHFYEVYYIWGHHENYVEQLQPDIIIEGYVEREIGEKIQ